eukprot:m.87164 g.87164  ORF g.87164 m.87164 type:complete len:155 (-) comp26041_c0_seq2:416-880(-)
MASFRRIPSTLAAATRKYSSQASWNSHKAGGQWSHNLQKEGVKVARESHPSNIGAWGDMSVVEKQTLFRSAYSGTRKEIMKAEAIKGNQTKVLALIVGAIGASLAIAQVVHPILGPIPHTFSKEYKAIEFEKQTELGKDPVLFGATPDHYTKHM